MQYSLNHKIKQLVAVTLFGLFCVSASPFQGIYSTRTGQISFFSSTPAEDIKAVNNEVSSKVSLENGQMVFTVLMKGFRFRNALMREHFNENYLESSKWPKADFKGTIQDIKNVDFSRKKNWSVNVQGDLTIHGVTQKVTLPGKLEMDDAGKLNTSSVFKLTLKDYNIKGGAIGDRIAHTIEVTVNCKYD